jgi:hypothetical protein
VGVAGGSKQSILFDSNKQQSLKSNKEVNNVKIEEPAVALPSMMQSTHAPFPISYWQNYFTSKFNSGKSFVFI